ncbi:unnamed protein product [Chrysoparadoxa australica]
MVKDLTVSAAGSSNGGHTTAERQLDTLLAKAAQYSGFILKSEQTRLEEMKSAAEAEAEELERSKAASGGKRKKGGKRAKGGKKSKSNDGKALAEATVKMAKGRKEESGCMVHGQPKLMVGGTLKGYQVEGLQWLATLYENGLSGILADEMGLGKTVQVISLIAHLRCMGVNGPFIICAPLATLPNWINEFKKWTPSIATVLYHGPKADRAYLRREQMRPGTATSADFPVVITSYEICIADRAYLSGYNWVYMVIDEGQRIKNMNCRLVRELKQIPTQSRLLLSGTPIQNTLEELWSLLNFINPTIFDDFDVFQSWFGFGKGIGKVNSVDDIVSEEEGGRIVSKLHEILRPFLLRRVKKEVLGDEMPPKQEIVVYAGMTPLQRHYYQLIQEGKLRDALMQIKVEGAKDVSQVNQVMNQRKVCQHPFLFGEPTDPVSGQYVGVKDPEVLIQASGKMALLDRLLRDLKKNGHKVLIFSQMTSMLDILEDYLRHREWGYCRIDGSVDLQDRQRQIDEYNTSDELFVFLLSTRAGGLGINLAAADTCIIYDSDWNPHQDSQAQDRCHRIGQKKSVMVYRLLTTGSVEIDMMEKAISKKKLERMAVQGGDFRKAGRRSRGQLTSVGLRKLLQDDVKDLLSRKHEGSSGEGAISEEELSKVLDRSLIFAEGNEPKLPSDGAMYDVVDPTLDSLLSDMS